MIVLIVIATLIVLAGACLVFIACMTTRHLKRIKNP